MKKRDQYYSPSHAGEVVLKAAVSDRKNFIADAITRLDKMSPLALAEYVAENGLAPSTCATENYLTARVLLVSDAIRDALSYSPTS